MTNNSISEFSPKKTAKYPFIISGRRTTFACRWKMALPMSIVSQGRTNSTALKLESAQSEMILL
jgi:hypothetical protein